ncbi:Sulfite exporter TauE/SafE family protein [Seminavis robusta]|uniref:Sulfite exporter TauE/SafE family protein n=1 Tax=Seminavis robusta TaxID=568900 RepID=A0A9N8HXD6_9STRA|nr:Sulfite exporter TauE/SafE family protein [Seminavis robusta]|eukprot:Sro2423_g327240.1 Sulfite exporter TauE/SafE family protein (478) ;mRNA; r:9300-10901
MTDSSSRKHIAASVAFSLAGCVLWMATHGFRENHGGAMMDDSMGITSRRFLASILDEDEAIPELFPLQLPDYIGFFCAITGLILAAGAGIGGGGILVPIFILIFEFPVKHAIPLASVTVLGGAFANNLLNFRKAHPDHPSRPAIDWDLIIQLEPMTIAGALIGADLNDLLPDTVLVVLLFVLLSATAYKTLQKAHKLHEKETEEMEKAQKEAVRLLASGNAPGDVEAQDKSVVRSTYGSVASRRPQAKVKALTHEPSFGADQVHQAWIAAGQLSALFVIVTILNLLKGGPGESGGGPMGLQSCGATCFWVTEAGIFFLIIGFAIFVRHGVLRRMESGGPVLSEIDWDEENTIRYPLYAIVAGLVAGMFGVGGGIIKGPLMLALGVHPAVASATSACMILFTSSTSTISYMIFGLLLKDYAAGCLITGFLATLLGQTLMSMLMRKYNRDSYIAYTIGIVVGLSAIAMTLESVLAIIGP